MTLYVNTANGGALNMRNAPSSSAAILAQIPNKTQLEATVDGEWAKTTYGKHEGYVMVKFLSGTAPSSSSSIDKTKLKKIYDSLQETLKLIDEVLK